MRVAGKEVTKMPADELTCFRPDMDDGTWSCVHGAYGYGSVPSPWSLVMRSHAPQRRLNAFGTARSTEARCALNLSCGLFSARGTVEETLDDCQ